MPTKRLLLIAVILASGAGPASAAGRFNWDDLGTEFCRLAVAGDVAGMRPLLSPSLFALIETAGQRVAAGARMPVRFSHRFLFQSYDAEAPGCLPRTRNVALVDVDRKGPKGAWTDYLVVVPEADGSTRIDDILFSTRRSDTLRSRLGAIMSIR